MNTFSLALTEWSFLSLLFFCILGILMIHTPLSFPKRPKETRPKGRERDNLNESAVKNTKIAIILQILIAIQWLLQLTNDKQRTELYLHSLVSFWSEVTIISVALVKRIAGSGLSLIQNQSRTQSPQAFWSATNRWPKSLRTLGTRLVQNKPPLKLRTHSMLVRSR